MPAFLQGTTPPVAHESRSSGTLTCKVLTSLPELEALAPAWQELLDASPRPEPMLAPAWLLTWWRIYGAGRTPAVGALYDGDRLVGLAPMCRRTFRYRPGIPFRRLEWLGADVDEGDGVCSEYQHLLARPGFEAAVCDRFVSEIVRGGFGAWDEWVLAATDGDHPLTPTLTDAWIRAGFAVERKETNVSPYLELPASWDGYLKALPKKKRHNITSALRGFETWAAGTAEIHQAVDAESLRQGKVLLTDLHCQRWAEKQDGTFLSSRFSAFHDAFQEQMLAQGRLHLYWLTVRGEPVGAHYSFSYGDKVYYYQAGRRPDLPPNVRPGIVLLVHVLQRLMAAGVREFDFLMGQSQYKQMFTQTTRPLVELRVCRSGWREPLRQFCRWAAHRARAGRAWLRRPAAEAPATEVVNEG